MAVAQSSPKSVESGLTSRRNSPLNHSANGLSHLQHATRSKQGESIALLQWDDSPQYDIAMRGLFPLIVFLCALSAFAAVAWIVLRERRRYQRELAIRARLVEQARPVLYAAQCAACGGALSTWDGGLTPLPAGTHVAPAGSSRKLVVEYAARRECLGCRL